MNGRAKALLLADFTDGAAQEDSCSYYGILRPFTRLIEDFRLAIAEANVT
jgi:hypothetical protein